jgi:hypothetical protein
VRTLTDAPQCEHGKDDKDPNKRCPKPARAALKTTNGVKLTTVVYYDDRQAPKVATRYCKEHAVATLLGLGSTLIELDD